VTPDNSGTADTLWRALANMGADATTMSTITAEQWIGHALPERPAPGEPRNRAERRAAARRARQAAKHQRREERKLDAFWRWLNGVRR
jgi:hypothetical protein